MVWSSRTCLLNAGALGASAASNAFASNAFAFNAFGLNAFSFSCLSFARAALAAFALAALSAPSSLPARISRLNTGSYGNEPSACWLGVNGPINGETVVAAGFFANPMTFFLVGLLI